MRVTVTVGSCFFEKGSCFGMKIRKIFSRCSFFDSRVLHHPVSFNSNIAEDSHALSSDYARKRIHLSGRISSRAGAGTKRSPNRRGAKRIIHFNTKIMRWACLR